MPLLAVLAGCTKEETVEPTPQIPTAVILKFKFDSTQVRLNNLGQPVGVLPGHGAQSPVFNRMSAH
ncbi:MAG: hypothetical protein R2810_06540 [Flavobacteriales bacterium]